MSEIEATEIERALFRLKAPPRLAVHDADIKVYLGSKHIPLEKVRQIVEQRQLIPSLRKQEIPTAWLFAQLPDRSRSDTLPLTDWDLEVALQGAEHHESATYLFELCSERASDLMDADRLVLIQRLQGVWSVVSSRLSIEAIRSSEKAVHLARGPNGVVAHLDSSVFDFGQFVRDCALSAGLSVSLADTFRIVFIEELFAAEIELIGFTRQDSSDPDRISFQTLRSVSDEEEGETDVAVA